MRPPAVSVPLAVRLSREFFAQGDEEKKRGMDVSKMMDRETTSVAKMQLDFMQVVMSPLLRPLSKLLDITDTVAQLDDNVAAIGRDGERFFIDLDEDQQEAVDACLDDRGSRESLGGGGRDSPSGTLRPSAIA